MHRQDFDSNKKQQHCQAPDDSIIPEKQLIWSHAPDGRDRADAWKILQTHTGVVHNVSVNNSGIVRGGDSLGSNGNTKNFVFRILVFFNKVLDFVQ